MDTHLAELLATRLCHDLTGPIGAVHNGAEFMKEDGMAEDAADLIASSAAEAVARLQFYRVVYGRVPAVGETGIAERFPIAQTFLAGSKIPLHWVDDAGLGGLPHAAMRLLFNMILIASVCMLRKGAIHVTAAREEDGLYLSVSTEGGTIKWDASQQEAFDGKTSMEALEPKTAQLLFTHLLAQQAHAKLTVEHGTDGLQLGAFFPSAH